MQQITSVYGLDIETDTSTDGLDPAVAPVVAVALSSRIGDELFVGVEADLLRALDARLAELAPGIIATWNGAAFDLPFLADRARIVGVSLGLRLCLDRRLSMQRAPLPGHAGAYRAAWHHHGHVDAFRIYGGEAAPAHRSSLRNLVRRLGLVGDATRPQLNRSLTNEALHAHAPSDARLARILAERRRIAATRLMDRLEPGEATPIAVAARRLARQQRMGAPSPLPPVATV